MSQAATTDRPSVPDRVPAERVIDFNYRTDPRMNQDPYAVYRWLSELPHEIVWATGNGGHWIVTRNELMVEMFQRPDLFSNKFTEIPPRTVPLVMIPEQLDPPDHTKFKAVLLPRLGPKAVKHFDDMSRDLAQRYLDTIYAQGQADLMDAIAIPLPCAVFLTMFGLPVERTREFVHWKDHFFFPATPEVRVEMFNNIMGAITESIELKRRAPADDMLSYLVSDAAQVDGRALTDEELRSIGFLFFIAGLDTVTSALTSCYRYFAENPEQREAAATDPVKLNTIIEEVLRRNSVVNTVRTATDDFEWRGLKIRKDDQFVMSTILANLDEREYERAMTIDPEREFNRHIAFGGGAHRCVGSHLARIELRSTLQETLPRLKNLRLKPGAELTFYAGSVVGLTGLPVQWDVD